MLYCLMVITQGLYFSSSTSFRPTLDKWRINGQLLLWTWWSKTNNNNLIHIIKSLDTLFLLVIQGKWAQWPQITTLKRKQAINHPLVYFQGTPSSGIPQPNNNNDFVAINRLGRHLARQNSSSLSLIPHNTAIIAKSTWECANWLRSAFAGSP